MMFDSTITVFNYRKSDHSWYTSVFHDVNVIEVQGKTATQHGETNGDNVEILLNCSPGKEADGKRYVTPKAYDALETVADYFTLTPESDFIMIGDYGENEPFDDDDYDEGLYQALNDEHDGVYMITSATWYGLLPHFEIGGR